MYRRLTLLAALVLLSLPLARAQESDWRPKGMEPLEAHASFHTDFTINKSMLQSRADSLPDEDRPIVAQLRSITVDSFRYPDAGLYDPAALDAVRAQYRRHGWTHLVTQQAHAETDHPLRTDLWIRTKDTNVEGMVLLVANQRNINLVFVDGTISPLDLLHLRGHLGIPEFEGDSFKEQK